MSAKINIANVRNNVGSSKEFAFSIGRLKANWIFAGQCTTKTDIFCWRAGCRDCCRVVARAA